jgi:surface polysaccharide O-acyltransferase-like enzyme
VLISGWFGIRPSLRGLCRFAFTCVFAVAVMYAVMLAAGREPFNLWGVEGCLFVTGTGWFVKSYAALYILSPVLNAFLARVSRRQLGAVVAAFYLFQTVYGWTGAVSWVSGGYSAFSFVGLYLLAAYFRRYGAPWRRGGLVVYLAAVAANTALYWGYQSVAYGRGHTPMFNFINICNPLVVAGALGLVMWFSTLDMGYSRWINGVARSSFTVYLTHTAQCVYSSVFLPAVVAVVGATEGWVTPVAVAGLLVGVFALGVVVDLPRRWLWGLVERAAGRLWRRGSLFAAEVGGDFAPVVGVPLDDGVDDRVALDPGVGPGEQLKDAGVARGVGELGGVASAAQPAQGGA